MADGLRGRGLPVAVPTPVRRAAGVAGGALLFWLVLQRVWPTPAGVVVQGIIIGALTALISFGIALVYRANRVINFAQADLGAIPASIGVVLLTRGEDQLAALRGESTGGNVPYWIVLPLVLLLAVALGSLVERVFVRRFSRAPRLILMVVTIGVAQILAGVGTAIPFWFGNGRPAERFPSPFAFSFKLDPVVFDGNDLIAVVAVVVMIAGVTAFLRFASVGVAIRACAESAERAGLLGVNVARIQNVVWVVATVMATVAMTLRAGIVGLPLGTAFGPTILLRALAAAVIGRMENFGVMFLAAAGLGVVESAVIFNEGSGTLVDPAVFVLVIGALLLQRRRRESRVEDQAVSSWQDTAGIRPVPRELAGLPEVRWGFRGLGALLVAGLVLLPLVLSDGDTNLASAVFVFAIIAVSLVILTGWAGEISLGQMAFVGIGAAVAGALNYHFHWDLTVTILAAGGVGAVASVVIGLPALRIRGLFLAVSTMAFALMTSSYLLNRDYFGFIPDNLTERVVRRPLLGSLDISGETTFYFVCLGVLGAVLWSALGLQRSRTHRVLIATRENERAAQAFGLNLVRAKLTAFAFSGFFASLAGGLFAIHQQAVGEGVFLPAESVRALTMVVVGGLGSLPGAILGAVFIKSTEWFNPIVPRDFRFLFTFAGSGIALIFILMLLPGGLGSAVYRLRDRWLRMVAARRGIALAGPVPAGDSERLSHGPTLVVAAQEPAPEGDGTGAFLEVREIDVSYGAVQVLFGVSLGVEEGEIIALLGTNGAGKSTVLRAVSGLVGTRGGRIAFDGRDITGKAAHKIAALGIIQVPGGRGIFPSLTVAENLRMAGWMHRRRDPEHVAGAHERVLGLFPILRDRLDTAAAALSGGQQQMLTLGMAFIAKPRLLMIDELSLGLAPSVVEQLLDAVQEFRARGTTVILVEQSVNVALTVADSAYFMEKGEVRFHGPTRDLLDRPDILRSVYLEGASARAGRRPRQADPGPRPGWPGPAGKRATVLEIEAVSKSFSGIRAVDSLSLSVRQGEILGIIGPNGAGKTTLFDLVSGFLLPDAGTIRYLGRDVTRMAPDVRSRLGLARSFQDARLFGPLTVHQVVAVALDRTLAVRDPVAAALNLPDVDDAERRLAAQADELVELMGVTAFRDTFVAELSTGTRRIVDLACQVAMEPRVVLLDEPSSGIAQREAEALGPLLLRVREETGAALLLIEHDMPLVRSVSDRMVALDLGAKVVEGDAEAVLADPRVVASYLGSRAEVVERSGSGSARHGRKPGRAGAARARADR